MGLKLIPFSRFKVSDRSMEPAYREGDHLLTFNWSNILLGDAVVLKKGQTFFLKRVSRIDGGFYIVEGDNKQLSAKIKPVRHSEIIGKVIFKY